MTFTLPTRAERRAQRAALKVQKKETQARLREQVAVQKARMAEERKTNPLLIEAERQRRKKRQRRLMLILLLLLLLLLLLRCECEEGPPGAPDAGPGIELITDAGPAVPVVKKKRARLRGKLKSTKRPAMDVQAPPPPSWLDQFRLQVAARSPKLAACFNGNAQPGALRWSALVHAQSGRVTEAKVESAFRGETIDESQVRCLVKGLTEKTYKLDEPNPEAAARRVSLIFEF